MSVESADKSARIVVRVRLVHGKLNGEVAARRGTPTSAQVSSRMSVSVSLSVSVPWNLSFSLLRALGMSVRPFICNGGG